MFSAECKHLPLHLLYPERWNSCNCSAPCSIVSSAHKWLQPTRLLTFDSSIHVILVWNLRLHVCSLGGYIVCIDGIGNMEVEKEYWTLWSWNGCAKSSVGSPWIHGSALEIYILCLIYMESLSSVVVRTLTFMDVKWWKWVSLWETWMYIGFCGEFTMG